MPYSNIKESKFKNMKQFPDGIQNQFVVSKISVRESHDSNNNGARGSSNCSIS